MIKNKIIKTILIIIYVIISIYFISAFMSSYFVKKGMISYYDKEYQKSIDYLNYHKYAFNIKKMYYLDEYEEDFIDYDNVIIARIYINLKQYKKALAILDDIAETNNIVENEYIYSYKTYLKILAYYHLKEYKKAYQTIIDNKHKIEEIKYYKLYFQLITILKKPIDARILNDYYNLIYSIKNKLLINSLKYDNNDKTYMDYQIKEWRQRYKTLAKNKKEEAKKIKEIENLIKDYYEKKM
jgi:hypothetical protein